MGDTFQIILACVGVAGALGNIVLGLMLARMGRTEKQTDKTADKQTDTDRLVAALNALTIERGGRAEKVEDRTHGQAEAMAAVLARLTAVERMSHDCDELKAEVAVLKDWKDRNGSRWDQAITDIAAMKRDIKTLFDQMPDLVAAKLIERLGIKTRSGAHAGA